MGNRNNHTYQNYTNRKYAMLKNIETSHQTSLKHLEYKKIECTVHKYSAAQYTHDAAKYSKTIVEVGSDQKASADVSQATLDSSIEGYKYEPRIESQEAYEQKNLEID